MKFEIKKAQTTPDQSKNPKFSSSPKDERLFLEQMTEIMAIMLEGLEADLDFKMTLEINLSVDDYAIRDQTITVVLDVNNFYYPTFTLLIIALREMKYAHRTENNEPESVLERWQWEVGQLMDELIELNQKYWKAPLGQTHTKDPSPHPKAKKKGGRLHDQKQFPTFKKRI